MKNRDLTELHQEFVNERRYSTRRSPATIRGYVATFELFQKLMPGVDLNTLTIKTLNEFFKRLEQRDRVVGKGEIRNGVRISTIGTYRSKLNSFFDWLVQNKYLADNPFKHMRYPRIIYSDRKFLNKQQLERIWLAVSLNIDWHSPFIQKRSMALIGTLLNTGVRRGELIQLKVLDLDLEKRELHVRGETSKSRRDRFIPINSAAYKLLVDYLKARKEKDYKNPYLFVSNSRDQRLSFDGFKHFVNKVIEGSGVKFHVHQYRHTFSVNFLANGGSLAALKQLLGHTDLRMTEVYLRCLPTHTLRPDVESLANMENLI